MRRYDIAGSARRLLDVYDLALSAAPRAQASDPGPDPGPGPERRSPAGLTVPGPGSPRQTPGAGG